jgi:hypothetical protein
LVAVVANPTPDLLRPLEQRIRRLEDALAHLQDLGHKAPADPERSGEQIQQAPPQMPPVLPAGPSSTALLLDVGKRLLDTAADVMAPPAPVVGRPYVRRQYGLFWDTIAQVRAGVRMYVDPRYRKPWHVVTLPPVLLTALLFSYYWVPGTSIPLIGFCLNKVVDLILVYVLFSVVDKEVRRYRETSPDLPSTLRL